MEGTEQNLNQKRKSKKRKDHSKYHAKQNDTSSINKNWMPRKRSNQKTGEDSWEVNI